MASPLFSLQAEIFTFRMLRLFSVLFLIIFIHSLLLGSFRHISEAGRDDLIQSARRQIMTGLLGSLAMGLLFFIASVALARLSR